MTNHNSIIEKAKDDFITLEDGYQYYWVDDKGALSAYNLRLIADELDRINKDWQEQVDKLRDESGGPQ